jgi:hypothetical protein
MKLNLSGNPRLPLLIAGTVVGCAIVSGCSHPNTAAGSAAQLKVEMGTGTPPPDQLAQIKAYNDKMYATMLAKSQAAQEAIKNGKPPPQ